MRPEGPEGVCDEEMVIQRSRCSEYSDMAGSHGQKRKKHKNREPVRIGSRGSRIDFENSNENIPNPSTSYCTLLREAIVIKSLKSSNCQYRVHAGAIVSKAAIHLRVEMVCSIQRSVGFSMDEFYVTVIIAWAEV